jgi:hypothetical protein
MNEIDYYRMQEDAAEGQVCLDNLNAILSANGGEMTVADLYRSIYKYIDCGPWLSVQLHDGTWKHCDELHGIENGNVRALLVGSIVEGCDAEVTGRVLDLLEFETPEDAVAAFDHEVDQVNAEACALWDEVNAT